MGGEKAAALAAVYVSAGSPPRGRGKAGLLELSKECVGITPALAGKSREIPLHLRAAKDHPRVGGEKFGGEGLR